MQAVFRNGIQHKLQWCMGSSNICCTPVDTSWNQESQYDLTTLLTRHVSITWQTHRQCITTTSHPHEQPQCQRSHSFTHKKIHDFSRTPWIIFQDLFRARKCLNIKEKNIFRAENPASTLVNVDRFCFQWCQLNKHSCFFSIWTTRKMNDFQGHFSRTLSFNFQDFSGPVMKKSRTFQEAWEPCNVQTARSLMQQSDNKPFSELISHTYKHTSHGYSQQVD